MTNTDLSRGNGTDTLTVSANSPLFDLLDHMEATHRDPLDLLEDLTNYAAHINSARADAVEAARSRGESWQAIADRIGVTRQAAQQRYGGGLG